MMVYISSKILHFKDIQMSYSLLPFFIYIKCRVIRDGTAIYAKIV